MSIGSWLVVGTGKVLKKNIVFHPLLDLVLVGGSFVGRKLRARLHRPLHTSSTYFIIMIRAFIQILHPGEREREREREREGQIDRQVCQVIDMCAHLDYNILLTKRSNLVGHYWDVGASI